MKLEIPVEKDPAFTKELYSILSENLIELADENLKWPNQIIFSGLLGIELYQFIEEKGWNFSGFELKKSQGPVNSIIFKYSSPLTQKSDATSISFGDSGTLNNTQINGVPSKGMMEKMIMSYSNPSFTTEKTVRPEKKIQLRRRL